MDAVRQATRFPRGVCQRAKPGNFRVEVAENGQRAIEILEEGGFDQTDVIVLDLLMPILDGLRFLRWLRDDARSDVPVLVITSVDSRALTVETRVAGATEVLVKPVALEKIVAKLQALARRGTGTKPRGGTRELEANDASPPSGAALPFLAAATNEEDAATSESGSATERFDLPTSPGPFARDPTPPPEPESPAAHGASENGDALDSDDAHEDRNPREDDEADATLGALERADERDGGIAAAGAPGREPDAIEDVASAGAEPSRDESDRDDDDLGADTDVEDTRQAYEPTL